MPNKILFFRLPLPWLLYTIINLKPVVVDSQGVGCSISLLFIVRYLTFYFEYKFIFRRRKLPNYFYILKAITLFFQMLIFVFLAIVSFK